MRHSPGARVSAGLALTLLGVQILIPWTVGHYITQDGPSHLYTAVVFRNLLLHPHGQYASVYRIQPRLVSNWATTLVLGLVQPLMGADRAEAALASLWVLLGFVCVTYFRRALEPGAALDPLTNFLINSWFLWIGFYNFYLGMALCLLIAGFYLRRAHDLSGRAAAGLAFALAGLFFVHVMPAALAVMAVVFITIWRRPPRLWLPLAALLPVSILLLVFVRHGILNLHAGFALAAPGALPLHIFSSARTMLGDEHLLAGLVLIYTAAGLALIRRKEWATGKTALAAAAVVCAAATLVLPDYAFGGNAIKARLAWAAFLFGVPVAAQRLKWVPLNLGVACLLAASLVSAQRNLQGVSRAADAYSAVLSKIPPGATFARLRYPAGAIQQRFGYDMVQMDPLLHADSWAAVRTGSIDLTDPWPAARLFPVGFRKEFSGQQQTSLWNMEDGSVHGPEPAIRVLSELRFDYFVIAGHLEPELESGMTELAADDSIFLRIYQRF